MPHNRQTLIKGNLMLNFCALDIETVPRTDLPKECIPALKPPAKNLVDPIKIEKAKAEAEQARIKQMSLDPDLCQVVCVGTAMKGESPISSLGREFDNVSSAWCFIEVNYFKHIPLVIFNGIQFDLPVLWHAAIRLGISVDPRMYKDLTKKYDNKYHFDIMQIMAGWDRTRYKSFDFYLHWLGLEPKTGDGSMVYEWWKGGGYETIRTYCEADVDSLVKLWEKIEPYVREEE